MSHVKVVVHVVFSTKKRVPFIDEALEGDLYPYMAGIIRHKGATLLALGGMPDHVHLLIRLKADLSLSSLMQSVKAISSKWIHERAAGIPEFSWQSGYSAFSVSHSMEATVRSYILNQKEHHRKVGFEQELVALLGKHELDFNPEYLFD